MKVMTLDQAQKSLGRCLDQARKEDILITRNGKPAALIRGISQNDLEDYLLENDPRFMKIVEKRRREYRREGGIPLDVLAKELGLH